MVIALVNNVNGELIDYISHGVKMEEGFNTINYDASKLKSGMFHVVLKAGGKIKTKNMIVVK